MFKILFIGYFYSRYFYFIKTCPQYCSFHGQKRKGKSNLNANSPRLLKFSVFSNLPYYSSAFPHNPPPNYQFLIFAPTLPTTPHPPSVRDLTASLENFRNLRFSEVFKGYRGGTLVENYLCFGFRAFGCEVIPHPSAYINFIGDKTHHGPVIAPSFGQLLGVLVNT